MSLDDESKPLIEIKSLSLARPGEQCRVKLVSLNGVWSANDYRLAERRYSEPGEASWAGGSQACV